MGKYNLFSLNLVAYIVCTTSVSIEDLELAYEEKENNKRVYYFIVDKTDEVVSAVTEFKTSDVYVSLHDFIAIFKELKAIIRETRG